MKIMKEYYKLSEVAKMLNVSYVTVWRWCNDGKVATISLPSKQRRIRSDEVKRLLGTPETQDEEH